MILVRRGEPGCNGIGLAGLAAERLSGGADEEVDLSWAFPRRWPAAWFVRGAGAQASKAKGAG